ncbi:MAG: hypothetical protein AAF602_18740 [Myxococcota bacterium]
MRSSWLVIGAMFVIGCGQESTIGPDGEELPPFDPSNVVFADGCVPVPEARSCIEAHPVDFLPAQADAVSQRCEQLGYTCCDPDEWISQAAASCIVDGDARMSPSLANQVTVECYEAVFGPMYGVYERTQTGTLTGIGVHAATGRVTWFDDGSGVFS